jgi:hypothetical protein
MSEFNMNAGGLNWYDISNILAFTVVSVDRLGSEFMRVIYAAR